MLKTLVKKQLQGMLTARYRTGKGGKQKSKAGFLVYALLMLYVAGVLCFLFFSMMQSLCAPLLSAGAGMAVLCAGGHFGSCAGGCWKRIPDTGHFV